MVCLLFETVWDGFVGTLWGLFSAIFVYNFFGIWTNIIAILIESFLLFRAIAMAYGPTAKGDPPKEKIYTRDFWKGAKIRKITNFGRFAYGPTGPSLQLCCYFERKLAAILFKIFQLFSLKFSIYFLVISTTKY